ncbi:MAG: transcription-repair coupling factor [Anaerolineales bacterium]|nr:transcription-repair coupling factor [Anaerolineales bacterium]
MFKILQEILTLKDFQQLLENIQGNEAVDSLGLIRSARLPVLASTYTSLGRPCFLVTNRANRALALVDELKLLLPEAPIFFFPDPSTLFYENAPWGETTRRERLMVLSQMVTSYLPGSSRLKKTPIFVASARGVMGYTMPRREFVKATRSLKVGQQVEPQSLVQDWVTSGYEAVNTVIAPGQFARRGGILDIWPPANEHPSRLDFFGDEIDSFRYFDPATQRTIEKHERIMISPAREYLVPVGGVEAISPGEKISEFHIPLLHSQPSTVMDYLPREALIFLDNADSIRDAILETEEQAVSLQKESIQDGSLDPDFPLPYMVLGEVLDELTRKPTIQLGPAVFDETTLLARHFIPGPRFGGQLRTFLDYLHDIQKNGTEAIIVSRQATRLEELWHSSIYEDDIVNPPEFLQGSLADGWILEKENGAELHLLTDGEIFGWKRPQPRHRPRAASKSPEEGYAELRLDDWVVHVDHGIGIFKGLSKREIDGVEHEYLCIEYADNDQLYVPVHQADRLTRYVGARHGSPSISRLGGTEWKTVKEKVRKAVQEVAEDLLDLYARRKTAGGYSFSKDTVWQNEMEASFPYIETPDQVKVIQEVKNDMEKDQPMDRLICGDVGYGKTEVALRAAFKAVMDSRQVAILVPTTVLAQQHYRTFRERLAAYPVNVEMLSRFRTPHEQTRIIHKLAEGEVDIIIGTHRLVQTDIQFKDLGLVIIDEEQRFGVSHKEYLKKLRTEVDVLTMTATPIPRTLYMTLTNVRDISTISTPPQERLPISTHVGPYSAKLIRQAVLRELERGGQVFFVHNRVQTIDAMKQQLNKLVPEAKIEIAHGQMQEKDLEKRMRKFSSGSVDMLLCTSIIEAGLDIPNANTLIVDRADTFGLAQLYQLRGRVGRGAQRAYAYFFRHPQKSPTEDGQQRLETLAENTQLGAGLNIAMRDLEIRGAGDILGNRQHGHITAVGFHLYTRLLAQAVTHLRQQGYLPKEKMNTSLDLYHPLINVDLPIVIAIPDDYVPDSAMRISLYRRLSEIRNLQEIEVLVDEFSDRFGEPPGPIKNMFFQLRVKVMAEKAGLDAVTQESGQLVLRYPLLGDNDPERNYPQLGNSIRTSKNTIWMTWADNPFWQEDLISVLDKLVFFQESVN